MDAGLNPFYAFFFEFQEDVGSFCQNSHPIISCKYPTELEQAVSALNLRLGKSVRSNTCFDVFYNMVVAFTS